MSACPDLEAGLQSVNIGLSVAQLHRNVVLVFLERLQLCSQDVSVHRYLVLPFVHAEQQLLLAIFQTEYCVRLHRQKVSQSTHFKSRQITNRVRLIHIIMKEFMYDK